jgi:hypothetical protein
MRYLLCSACAAAALVVAACGHDPPALVPVSGRVYYHGRPLPGGTIVFTPDADRGGRGPLACTEVRPDGTYILATDGRPGAAPGWHRVTIAPRSNAGPNALPPRYRDPDLSGQSAEVRPDRPNRLDFYLD